jgi:hypothetical protein
MPASARSDQGDDRQQVMTIPAERALVCEQSESCRALGGESLVRSAWPERRRVQDSRPVTRTMSRPSAGLPPGQVPGRLAGSHRQRETGNPMRRGEESDNAAGAQKNQIRATSTLIEIQPNAAQNESSLRLLSSGWPSFL